MNVRMELGDGSIVADDDRIRVIANDFLATGGDDILSPVIPDGGFVYDEDPRLVRDVIANWLRRRGGSLHADDFRNDQGRRWNLPDELPVNCSL